MFGRHRQAVLRAYGTDASAFAVLRVYSPQAAAAALAAGMGAAAVGSGAAMRTLPDGRQVSAVSEAVDSVINWGRQDQARYLRLPPHVMAVITTDAVVLHEWTLAGGLGKSVARWRKGAFAATEDHFIADRSVRVTLPGGMIVVLTGGRGPTHRAERRTIDAVLRMST